MTLDELLARESIRHTLASYNIWGDQRADAFTSVFTDDAVFVHPGVTYEGIDQIRAWWERRRAAHPFDQGMTAAEPPRFARHNLTTSRIELTGPDTAEGHTYFQVNTQIGPDHCGVYTDKYRKTGDRWLIAYRRVEIDWIAPTSVLTRR